MNVLNPARLRAATTIGRDTAGVAAAASISLGFWLAYPPLGYIVGGALVLAGVVLAARNAVADEPTPPGAVDFPEI